MTDDELTIFYVKTNRIFTAVRSSKETDFDAATEVALAPAGEFASPTLSRDGLRLVFQLTTPDGFRIAEAKRESITAAFTTFELVDVGPANTPLGAPKLTDTELYYVAVEGGSTAQQYRAVRAADGTYGKGSPIPSLRLDGSGTRGLVPSRDGTYGYLASNRPHNGPGGGYDIFRANHAGDVWSDITPVAELDTTDLEYPSWLSVDGCRLYYTIGTSLSSAIYLAHR